MKIALLMFLVLPALVLGETINLDLKKKQYQLDLKNFEAQAGCNQVAKTLNIKRTKSSPRKVKVSFPVEVLENVCIESHYEEVWNEGHYSTDCDQVYTGQSCTTTGERRVCEMINGEMKCHYVGGHESCSSDYDTICREVWNPGYYDSVYVCDAYGTVTTHHQKQLTLNFSFAYQFKKEDGPKFEEFNVQIKQNSCWKGRLDFEFEEVKAYKPYKMRENFLNRNVLKFTKKWWKKKN